MRSRRTTLQTLGSGIVIGLTGCLGSQEIHPEEHVSDWHDEPLLGSRPPIKRAQTVDVPPDLSDQCSWAAANAVEEHITNQIGTHSSLWVDYTKSTALPDAGWTIIVYREMIIGPNGRVVKTPAVSFDTIHNATPSAVRMTVRNGDSEHLCRYTVHVADTYQQMD